MTKPYSADLRVRVVEAVDEGAARQEAAERGIAHLAVDKLAPTACQASASDGPGISLVVSLPLPMALLSFADSTPDWRGSP
jgi:hypothetical protein